MFSNQSNKKKLRLANANFIHYIAWLWAAVLFATPGIVFGIDWSGWVLDPTFSINEEFNDNPRLSFEEKDAGFISVFSPGFLLRRHEERWRVNLAARLDYTIYSGTDIPDRDSERVDLGSLFHLDERNLFQFDSSYKRDTLLRRILFDIDEGFDIDEESIEQREIEDIDIGLVDVNIRRNRINLVPSWQHELTERTKVRLLYDFIDQSYSEAEGLNLIDIRQHKIAGSALYEFAPLRALSLNIDASRITSENDVQTDNLALLAGLEYPFSEILTSEARAGYRVSSVDNNGGNENSSGFVGELTVRYRAEASQFSGTVGRFITPSGSGQANETDRIRFQYAHSLLPRLSFVLGVDVFRTQFVGGDSSRERRFFDVRPTLIWNWTQWWSIEAGYRYLRREEEDNTFSGSGDSNAIFMAITYTPPPAGR